MKIQNENTAKCAGKLHFAFSIPYNLSWVLTPIACIAVIAAAFAACYALCLGIIWLFEKAIIPARDFVVCWIGPAGTCILIAAVLAIIYKVYEKKINKAELYALLIFVSFILLALFFSQPVEELPYLY